MVGSYRAPSTVAAMERRFGALWHPLWVLTMVNLIRRATRKSEKIFRIHDSGDLQGLWHLRKWVDVARRTPEIKYWMPTREYGMVQEFLKTDKLPDNLCVRLSAHMNDGLPPLGYGLPVSTVSQYQPVPVEAEKCPAPEQGGKCKDCRKCWDTRVPWVAYTFHTGNGAVKPGKKSKVAPVLPKPKLELPLL
jgi:hypothetical protein